MSPEGGDLAAELSRRVAASGPIGVDAYMDASNRAYYSRGTAFGAAGDFITAPEISQMFGELVGLWLADLWLRAGRPDVAYVELGPGRGTLAADALRAAERFGLAPPVHFVETSEALRIRQQAAVPQAMFHGGLDGLPPVPLLIVANEFFDALPVRQAIRTHAGWRERVVVRGEAGRFAAVAGTRPVDPPPPRPSGAPPPGSIAEWSPLSRIVMETLADHLVRHGGALLVIDYGHDAPGHGDTLQAVEGHRHADPFAFPGTRDLTAHVDFAALAMVAAGEGATVHGPVGQGELLCRLGIDARLELLARANPGRVPALRADRDRLVEEGQMGRLFRGMAVTGKGWPVPEGFA